MAWTIEVVQAGPVLSVAWRVEENGESQPRESFQKLEPPDQTKAASLFKRLADHGMIKNVQKFKQLKHKKSSVWELKPTNQVRLLGEFYRIEEARYFVIVLCVIKKRKRHKGEKLDKAIRLTKEGACE